MEIITVLLCFHIYQKYLMSRLKTTKNEMLKDIKLDIITKFNKENYYKNYDYSIKHLKNLMLMKNYHVIFLLLVK